MQGVGWGRRPPLSSALEMNRINGLSYFISKLIPPQIKRTEHKDATDAERDRFVFYLFCFMMLNQEDDGGKKETRIATRSERLFQIVISRSR